MYSRGPIPKNSETPPSYDALLLGVPARINGSIVLPLLRQVFQGKDRRHRADRNACTTVDTFDWMDVKLRFLFEIWFILAWMDAIHRANIDAGGVFCADARLGNYVGHSRSPFPGHRLEAFRASGGDRRNLLVPLPCRDQHKQHVDCTRREG